MKILPLALAVLAITLASLCHAAVKNVVLVHGAFADGSGWKPVAEILERDGYTVYVVQNPLTSLRSAVETWPLAKTDDSRKRLLAVIEHDVRRLDRLISDISDASRLDAELQRQDSAPVDLKQLLMTVVSVANEVQREDGTTVALTFEGSGFVVPGKAPANDKSKPDAGKTDKAKPEDAKAAEAAAINDEFDGDVNPYGIKHVELVPRCPNCTEEMGEHDTICLACGYNTMTRQWGKTEKNREARFYSLTPQGKKQLKQEEESWAKLTEGVARVIRHAQ